MKTRIYRKADGGKQARRRRQREGRHYGLGIREDRAYGRGEVRKDTKEDKKERRGHRRLR